MSSDFKLDAVISQNYEEPEFNSLNGKVAFDEGTNVISKIVNIFHKRGNRSIDKMSNAEHGGMHNWFSGKARSALDDTNLSLDGDEKQGHEFRRKSGPLMSGTAYCIASCSMILLNKVVLSSYAFNAGISLMFYQVTYLINDTLPLLTYWITFFLFDVVVRHIADHDKSNSYLFWQNLIGSVVVVVMGLFGFISLEKLNWNLIKVWIPVNVVFVGMLVSSMYSLKYINIAMVTILKNMTNILTAIGELYIFRKHQNQKVWTAMFLMIISAISGGITDLSFDGVGYAWQILNCILTASYSLTLRLVMDKAKQFTRSGSLNEVSMVLLNNLLSLPFAIFLIVLFDEWEYVINADITRTPMFWVVATASGLFGLAISFTSLWFLSQTSPTTYSLVGSLNKIPISIAGLVLFKVPLNLPNFFSIIFGLFAGLLFAKAKMS